MIRVSIYLKHVKFYLNRVDKTYLIVPKMHR